jgi:hypothetical protein
MALRLFKPEIRSDVDIAADALQAHRDGRRKEEIARERQLAKDRVALAQARLVRDGLFEEGADDETLDAAERKITLAERVVKRTELADAAAVQKYKDRDAELVAKLLAVWASATAVMAESAAQKFEDAKNRHADYMEIRSVAHRFGLREFSAFENMPPFIVDMSNVSSNMDLRSHPALDRFRHHIENIKRKLAEGKPL